MWEDYTKNLLLFTDYYEFSMTNGYFLDGIGEEPVVFDYFFRENPFNGGYAIVAGIEQFLDILDHFQFTEEQIEYLKTYDLDDGFLDYLSHMKNELVVKGFTEGRIVFANEPILEVSGPFIQCQLIETFLLNSLNFPTLCATKANRMWLASKRQPILEFGARRAQGFNGSLVATYASLVGGCTGTSNVLAAKHLGEGLKASGTQAHSWIMAYSSEYEAFKRYSEIYPKSSILLVDTYDTLKSGVPNAIKIGKELRQKGEDLIGIRLDSGDMAELSKEARKMLDEAGFRNTKIVISNDVDEYFIQKFKEQGGKADLWGIGTKLVTCYDDPALGGVYKLAQYQNDPRIKVSGNPSKTNIPGNKELFRCYKESGGGFFMKYDLMELDSELDTGELQFPQKFYNPYYLEETLSLIESSIDEIESMLKILFKDGKRAYKKLSWKDARNAMVSDLKQLPERFSSIETPDLYNIYISESLQKIRQKLIAKYKK
ncbi:MAG: nicotinate phosphoribosyltransferase [Promethearchaeota archaeon]